MLVVGWLIALVCVILRRTVVGCDPGESMFVVGWLIVLVFVVLRRTVVGCYPGESVFVVGYRPGWSSPEKDCCSL